MVKEKKNKRMCIGVMHLYNVQQVGGHNGQSSIERGGYVEKPVKMSVSFPVIGKTQVGENGVNADMG